MLRQVLTSYHQISCKATHIDYTEPLKHKPTMYKEWAVSFLCTNLQF